MAATRKKISKSLRFEITAPITMGLFKGTRGLLGQSADTSQWLRFSVSPSKFPDRQQIYLVPKEKDREETTKIIWDPKTWRRLTPEIEGSLNINLRAPEQEKSDVTQPPIGALGYGPEFSSSDYGHAEFYMIDINLPENEFGPIRDAFLAGKQPIEITIWTPDVEYGNAPDGSERVWEVWNDISTMATIVGFSLAFSTDIPRVGFGPKRTEEEEDLEETAKLKEAILHSREDIQLLCYQQAALNSSIVGLRRQVYILIAVAIAIAVFTALHLRF